MAQWVGGVVRITAVCRAWIARASATAVHTLARAAGYAPWQHTRTRVPIQRRILTPASAKPPARGRGAATRAWHGGMRLAAEQQGYE